MEIASSRNRSLNICFLKQSQKLKQTGRITLKAKTELLKSRDSAAAPPAVPMRHCYSVNAYWGHS